MDGVERKKTGAPVYRFDFYEFLRKPIFCQQISIPGVYLVVNACNEVIIIRIGQKNWNLPL